MKAILHWCVATLAALASAAPASAAIGELDPRFGAQGSVTVWDNSGPSVLETPDGRILVVGTTTWASWPRQITVQRFLANGAADTSFGSNGRVLVDLPGYDESFVSVAALQADGKIVFAGSVWDRGGRPYVARLSAEGALDTAFATNGVWVGGGTEPYYSSLLVTSTGEILATISDWTSDRIDQFASDGRPLGGLGGQIAPASMAQQADGRLIVSGYHRSLKASVVMRLDLQGNVDRSFGQDGFAVVPQGFPDRLSIEPGGDRIVLCGPGVLRLTTDGKPDTTFGTDGTGVVTFGKADLPAIDYCYRVLALQGGGVAYVGIRRGIASGRYDQALVGGLTPAGTIDRRFGAGSGTVAIDFGPLQGSDIGWFDLSAAFVRTGSGDALLSWLTADAHPALFLARVDLGGGAVLPTSPAPVASPRPAVVLPPAQTSSPPASAPTATARDDARTSRSGGGGRTDWALLLLGLAAALVAPARRNGLRRPPRRFRWQPR